MGAKLIAEDGPLAGLELDMNEGENEWILGRDPTDCDLVIEDPTTSRKHLRCRKTPHGYTLENLNLNNPIHVNEDVLEEVQVLSTGDSIKVGNTVFRFEMDPSTDLGERMEIHAEEDDSVLEDEEEEDDIFITEEEEEEDQRLAKINFDLSDNLRWVLKVVAGPNTGSELSLEPEKTYVLGSDPSACDVVFQDISVSRQHAELKVTREERVLIKDLQSRNGVVIDGKPLENETELQSNRLITLGTTACLIYDKTGDAATIVSPLLRSEQKPQETESETKEELKVRKESGSAFAGLIVLCSIIVFFVAIGYGANSLFKEQEIVREVVNYEEDLAAIMARYPSVKYSFTRSNNQLLLLGHLLTNLDRSQLLYDLQTLNFIKSVDDKIVIDEFVWQENNQVLAKNPNWQAVTIHAPEPGKFVVSGFLETQEQLDGLVTHLNLNFPYNDLLERRIIVEEAIVGDVNARLLDKTINDVVVQLDNGELTLSGSIGFDKSSDLETLITEFKNYKGVKSLKNLVVEIAPEQSMINLSDQYQITGYSNYGDASYYVVINGRILSRGDNLDGMTITSIRPNVVFLERGAAKYRIDYNP